MALLGRLGDEASCVIKGMGGMGVDDVEANNTAEKTRKQIKISSLDAKLTWNMRTGQITCNGKDLYGK